MQETRAGCYPSNLVKTDFPALRPALLRLLPVWGVALFLIGLGGCGGPAWAGEIEGQLFDGLGQPLAGVVVHLVEAKGWGVIPGLGSPPAERELLETATDKRGFFRFDLGPRPIKGRYFLRVRGDQGWDRLRYAPPLDRDVTRSLRSRGRAVVAIRVADAPGWSELAREIAREGGAFTERGKILRDRGMPLEKVALADGREEWRFSDVRFVFRGAQLLETRREPAAAEARPLGVSGDRK